MTVGEARKYLLDLTANYFGDGHVFFAENKMVQRAAPYITVKFSDINIGWSKNREYDPGLGCFRDFWEASTKAEVNLYTAGKNIAGVAQAPVYENTALEDMSEFIKYLDSETIQDDIDAHDINISLSGGIRDLSYLVNDSTYRFRVMAEFSVTFTDSAYGKFGQCGIELPNPSGGGNEDMAVHEESIEQIEIQEEKDGSFKRYY